MVIVLNGPLGVGKTQTAWRVIESMGRAALVDLDYVAAVTPFDPRLDRDREYAFDSAAVLARHHFRNAYTHMVITWVFENAEQLASLQRRFSEFGEFHAFRLTCSLVELEARVRRRGNDGVERELARARELHQVLEHASTLGDLGTPVSTDGLSVDQVATAIVRPILTHL